MANRTVASAQAAGAGDGGAAVNAAPGIVAEPSIPRCSSRAFNLTRPPREPALDRAQRRAKLGGGLFLCQALQVAEDHRAPEGLG